MSVYDDMRKLNSDGYEEAYTNCNEYWKEKIRGKRAEMNTIDDKMDLSANIDIDELIKYWNAALPPLVDYADMVGAPEWAYGCRYVYEDPDGYFIKDTIAALKELKELRELVNDTIVQIESNNQKLLNMIHRNKDLLEGI